jgi:hypothetical protein
MPLSDDELELLACLWNNKVIGTKHRRIDTIANMCHIRIKKGLKSTLRRLASQGYLEFHHGPAYSLSREGCITAQRYLGLY